MQAIPYILGSLIIVALLFAGGSAMRSSGAGPRKKELAAQRKLLGEIENHVLDQLQIDSNDLTAHRVAGLIRAHRQKELS